MNGSHKDSKRKVGANGEDLACLYLKKKGYKILDRNWQIRGGELDIICEHKGILVFVEVKARHSQEFGLAIESITQSKIRFLKRSAQIYISQHHLYLKQARFDLVTLDYEEGEVKIALIENIIDR